MSTDYLRYYDLESYLFENVTKKFHENGSIGAFDFFSIVVWKANRAKSVTAKRLRKAKRAGESLDALCHRLTAEVDDAPDPKARFMVLTDQPWGFALPMASAILAVLYPDEFTIYDYRVCEELQDFGNLTHVAHRDRLWSGYSRFLAAVRTASIEANLRDKDRYLSGRSSARQLQCEIDTWFESVPATAT
jgi:hypothetical protein